MAVPNTIKVKRKKGLSIQSDILTVASDLKDQLKTIEKANSIEYPFYLTARLKSVFPKEIRYEWAIERYEMKNN